MVKWWEELRRNMDIFLLPSVSFGPPQLIASLAVRLLAAAAIPHAALRGLTLQATRLAPRPSRPAATVDAMLLPQGRGAAPAGGIAIHAATIADLPPGGGESAGGGTGLKKKADENAEGADDAATIASEEMARRMSGEAAVVGVGGEAEGVRGEGSYDVHSTSPEASEGPSVNGGENGAESEPGFCDGRGAHSGSGCHFADHGDIAYESATRSTCAKVTHESTPTQSSPTAVTAASPAMPLVGGLTPPRCDSPDTSLAVSPPRSLPGLPHRVVNAAAPSERPTLPRPQSPHASDLLVGEGRCATPPVPHASGGPTGPPSESAAPPPHGAARGSRWRGRHRRRHGSKRGRTGNRDERAAAVTRRAPLLPGMRAGAAVALANLRAAAAAAAAATANASMTPEPTAPTRGSVSATREPAAQTRISPAAPAEVAGESDGTAREQPDDGKKGCPGNLGIGADGNSGGGDVIVGALHDHVAVGNSVGENYGGGDGEAASTEDKIVGSTHNAASRAKRARRDCESESAVHAIGPCAGGEREDTAATDDTVGASDKSGTGARETTAEPLLPAASQLDAGVLNELPTQARVLLHLRFPPLP